MDRLFLDANVLFSAAYREENGLLQLWQLTDVELTTSRFAVSEAERNLADESQRQRLAELVQMLTVFEGSPSAVLPSNVTLPDKDVPILAAAIEIKATHLLTGDKRRFGPLFGQQIDGVLVETPSVYLARRRGAATS